MGVNIKAFHKNSESKIKLFRFLAFLYVTARNVSLNFCYILFSANFQTKISYAKNQHPRFNT